jgi:hypothetical protein
LRAPISKKCANACAQSLVLSARAIQLALPIDGAYGHAVTLGPDGLKRELIDTATVLIEAQTR